MSRDEQAEVDTIVAVFFSAFDNRDGRVPNWAGLESLFIPEASITKIDGSEIERMSVREFIEPRRETLTNGTLIEFNEWKTDSQTFLGLGIATQVCNYCKNGQLNGHPYRGAGQKHFQLVLSDKGWKIVSVIWEDD